MGLRELRDWLEEGNEEVDEGRRETTNGWNGDAMGLRTQSSQKPERRVGAV